MFSIDVPKDIRKVKPKFIGPLTLRQTIWGLIGGACGYLGIAVQKSIMGPDADPSALVVMIFCAIPAIIGFIPIMELPAEKYFKLIFLNKFVFPKTRTCENGNVYRQIYQDAVKQYDKEEEKLCQERMKKDKDFRRAQKRYKKSIKKERMKAEKEFLKFCPELK